MVKCRQSTNTVQTPLIWLSLMQLDKQRIVICHPRHLPRYLNYAWPGKVRQWNHSWATYRLSRYSEGANIAKLWVFVIVNDCVVVTTAIERLDSYPILLQDRVDTPGAGRMSAGIYVTTNIFTNSRPTVWKCLHNSNNLLLVSRAFHHPQSAVLGIFCVYKYPWVSLRGVVFQHCKLLPSLFVNVTKLLSERC